MPVVHKVDASYGHTDAKENQNILALTADGVFKGIMIASETHDFASLADGAGETGSIAVPGAELGDVVLASVSVDISDQTLTAYVQAADVVEYRLQNESGGVLDLASATVRVMVFDIT